MRFDRIVVLASHLNQNPCFFHRIEYLSCKQLIPRLAIERFNIAILPVAAWFDKQGSDRQLPKNLWLSFSYSYRGLWSCSLALDIHRQIPNSVGDIIHNT